MKYSFNPYTDAYQQLAKDEIKSLFKLFPFTRIEHFGSTAIPGVGGKGIIDLFLLVDKNHIDEAKRKLEAFNYEFKLSGGVKDERWFFQKEYTIKNITQKYHLHLTYSGNQNFIDSIAFRDFLRVNHHLAQEYSEIKQIAVQAAAKYATKEEKKNAYMRAKQPVIQKILKLMKN